MTLYADGGWGCTCPSRENPCVHAREIAGRLQAAPESQPDPVNPTRPPPAPRGTQGELYLEKSPEIVGFVVIDSKQRPTGISCCGRIK